MVAQQALCDCELVQLNHPTYSADLAPSDYYAIRYPKNRLCGTWFIDWWITEDRCWGTVWESRQRILFSRHKQLKSWKNSWTLQEYVKFCRQVAKLFDFSLYHVFLVYELIDMNLSVKHSSHHSHLLTKSKHLFSVSSKSHEGRVQQAIHHCCATNLAPLMILADIRAPVVLPITISRRQQR